MFWYFVLHQYFNVKCQLFESTLLRWHSFKLIGTWHCQFYISPRSSRDISNLNYSQCLDKMYLNTFNKFKKGVVCVTGFLGQTELFPIPSQTWRILDNSRLGKTSPSWGNMEAEQIGERKHQRRCLYLDFKILKIFW